MAAMAERIRGAVRWLALLLEEITNAFYELE
jgi:hypothetical protein